MTLKIALGCIQPQQNQLLRPRSSSLEHTSALVYISWKAHHNVAPCFQIECASHCEVQQRDHKTLYRVCTMSVFTLFTNPELCFRCEKRWNERSDFYSFCLKAKTKHSECDCFTVSRSQQLTWFTWSVWPSRPQKLLHKLLSLLLFLLLNRWVIKYQLTGFQHLNWHLETKTRFMSNILSFYRLLLYLTSCPCCSKQSVS